MRRSYLSALLVLAAAATTRAEDPVVSFAGPGEVLAMVPGLVFEVPIYPEVGRCDGEIVVSAPGEFTAGSWGNRPGQPLRYWWMFDLDGPPGHPWTYIASGLGWPDGWQNPEVIAGQDIHSMGIGVHFTPDPVPVRSTSWGMVKQLHARAGLQ